MIRFERQHDLFNNSDGNLSEKHPFKDITINKKVIKQWQNKIINHQSPIFKYGYKNITQPSLFES